MDEQPQPSRPNIPVWGWILGILAIVLVVQLWTNGSLFNNTAEGDSIDVAEQLKAGNVTKMTQSGNKVTVEPNNPITVGEEPTEVEEFVWDRHAQISVYEELAYRGVSADSLANLPLETPDGSTWNTLFSILISLGPILLIIWIFSRGFRQIQGGGSNSIFGFGRSRAKNVNEGDRPTVTFDDVAGVEEAKEEVQEVVQFLREPERFIQVGARIPKGVLMVGPPGTGKTLLARAIAGEAGVPFYHISGSEFVEMFVGVGASRVRDLFNKAKENAPAIVFVDEIDAVGRQRGAGLGGGHDEREQTLNQILTEMDGFDKETNVIVIAATNRADVLDPALLRPGRFDRKVLVGLPDIKGREAILKVHARGKPIAKDVAFEDWARLTIGFSGADLENLVNESAIFAARRSSNSVTLVDFQNAFDRLLIGPERKSRVLSEEAREKVAYHEAGHAILRHFLPNVEPVHKVTIVPRGGAGGFVMHLPSEDSLKTRAYFEETIVTTLAGRAAEEIFYNEITTGASSDLQQATKMARAMITQYGMNDELGLPTYGSQSGNVFIGRDFNQREYSENAAMKIDNEIKLILDENYSRALEMVRANRECFDDFVVKLLEVETLNGDEFRDWMDGNC